MEDLHVDPGIFRVLGEVARTTVHLEASVGYLLRDFDTEQLSHRDLHGRILATVSFADTGITELTRRVDPGEHLDETKLIDLKLGDGLSENRAPLRVLEGFVPQVERGRVRLKQRDQSLVLELHHLLLKAAPDLTDRI